MQIYLFYSYTHLGGIIFQISHNKNNLGHKFRFVFASLAKRLLIVLNLFTNIHTYLHHYTHVPFSSSVFVKSKKKEKPDHHFFFSNSLSALKKQFS